MNSNYYEIKNNIALKQFIIDFEKSIKNHKVFTAIKLDDKKKELGKSTLKINTFFSLIVQCNSQFK